jgi:hypothetical protein
MMTFLKIVSFTGLVLTIVPSMLVFGGMIDVALHKQLMAVGMVLWFSCAYFWINKEKKVG